MNAEEILNLIAELRNVEELGRQLDHVILEFRLAGKHREDSFDDEVWLDPTPTSYQRQRYLESAAPELQAKCTDFCRTLPDTFLDGIWPLKVYNEHGYGYYAEPEEILRSCLDEIRLAAKSILAAVMGDIKLGNFEHTNLILLGRRSLFEELISKAMTTFRSHEVIAERLAEFHLTQALGTPAGASKPSPTRTDFSATHATQSAAEELEQSTESPLDVFRSKVEQADRSRYSSPNKWDRDVWIYEQHLLSKSWPEILEELNACPTEKGWLTMESAEGLRNAANRLAGFLGVEKVQGRSGRPRSKTTK